MTQEEKSLLLQDLCARLPYNLYVRLEEFNVPKNEAITEGFVGNYLKDNRCNDYDTDGILNELADGCIDIKPYLRPMSSMTDEEFQELHSKCPHSTFNKTNVSGWIIGIYGSEYGRISRIDEISKLIDWLNAHHFDYRGLIEKGLALEAPNEMYYG